ncbi:SDR family NAD(P)-dependent oxidoreductase [Roseobacter ponti]|uniref:SDR family NAD(P)-dependent oxidoreductase n=1 Tax=Roseobacter ponti TaxID=1891787 RepID=A0A858SNS5_9RHOB|nr:SDR family NAD(P)-dependent oxidoreductase [Roseobacter ponti]QJF50454.1 SDR family NAD(P)-dependent oxidoreductase [Roseobacter ponti]
MTWKQIADTGGVAVVTGGASGVGLAAARYLAQRGFDLLLADISADALDKAAASLRSPGGRVETAVTDVARADDLKALADQAFSMGPVAVLMNNAGIAQPSSTLDITDAWRQIIDVNFYGILNGVQAFVPRMIAAGRPATIINTGSKQGITTPPGNPAYNVSKAAVKVLTEQLAHELREEGAPVNVHLFVPGFTYTGMIAEIMPEKPPAAWTSEQCVDWLFDRIGDGDFYVLCPDNSVTPAVDARRVLWSAGDITENRPALSRWHPDWSEQFAEFEKDAAD